MPSTEPPSRTRLDRETITRAAVELLDEAGLAELSTRRLAIKLGVRSPTLYWHVRNKAELLDLVAETICADAFRIDETLPWREQLLSGLRQFRALLLAHRDAAALLRLRPPSGPHRLGHIDTTVGILLRAGFPARDTAAIAQLLAAHVLDSVQHETQPGQPSDIPDFSDYPRLRQVYTDQPPMTGAELFEFGCQVIIDGLVHRAGCT